MHVEGAYSLHFIPYLYGVRMTKLLPALGACMTSYAKPGALVCSCFTVHRNDKVAKSLTEDVGGLRVCGCAERLSRLPCGIVLRNTSILIVFVDKWVYIQHQAT